MASGELPFVVILGEDARGLETPRGGWTSDARHRWPVELGLWVGDCKEASHLAVALPC